MIKIIDGVLYDTAEFRKICHVDENNLELAVKHVRGERYNPYSEMGTWREYSCYLYAKATDVYVLEIQGTFLLDDDECPRGTVTDGNVRWEISEVLVVNEAIAKMLVEHDGDPTKWFECFGEPQDA